MHRPLKAILFPVLLGMLALSANATTVAVFGAPADGLANFNKIVADADGTAVHDRLTGMANGTSIVRSDYTIKRNSGAAMFPATYGTMTGQVIDISPTGTTPGIGAIGSGVSLTFSSAVNAIGFEVGDWGTCCRPSALYISFDNGAPILVGQSKVANDVMFNGRSEVFVGAFDDTASFTKVQFWGDGFGEYLVFGGTIHYAMLDQGSLPPSDVPEPASLALLGLGLIGVAGARRLRRQA